MSTFKGLGGEYEVPEFHVVLRDGGNLSLFAASLERAWAIVRTMYGGKALAVTPCYAVDHVSVFAASR